MSDATTAEEYIETLPERLMELAQKNETVQISIKSQFVPLLVSDLMRGVLTRISELPEGNLLEKLAAKATKQPVVHIKVNAQSAKMMVRDLRAGADIRKKQH